MLQLSINNFNIKDYDKILNLYEHLINWLNKDKTNNRRK